MTKRLCAALCLLAPCGIIHAQQLVEGFHAQLVRDWNTQSRAEADCLGQSVKDSYRLKTTYGTSTQLNTYSAPEWSGGCVQGRRDGYGRLRTNWLSSTNNGATIPLIFAHEGEMVAGQRAGLWCAWIGKNTFNDGKSIATPPDTRKPANYCTLYSPQASFRGVFVQTHFTQDTDGSWRIGPTARISREAMEQASRQLVAATRNGLSPEPFRLPVQIDALADLVNGGTAWLVPGPPLDYFAKTGQPPALAGKRVVLVLSTRAGTELQRWGAERKALLDATTQLREDGIANARKSFIEATQPEQLLRNWAATMALNGAQVRVADDLSPLADGSADYALLVDWGYHSQLPRSVRDLRRMKLCLSDDATCKEKRLLRSDASVWLIAPKLEVSFALSQEHASSEYVWLKTTKEQTMTNMLRSASHALSLHNQVQ